MIAFVPSDETEYQLAMRSAGAIQRVGSPSLATIRPARPRLAAMLTTEPPGSQYGMATAPGSAPAPVSRSKAGSIGRALEPSGCMAQSVAFDGHSGARRNAIVLPSGDH